MHLKDGWVPQPSSMRLPNLLRSDRGTVFIVVEREGECECTDPNYVFLSFLRTKIDLRHNHLLVFFAIIPRSSPSPSSSYGAQNQEARGNHRSAMDR